MWPVMPIIDSSNIPHVPRSTTEIARVSHGIEKSKQETAGGILESQT